MNHSDLWGVQAEAFLLKKKKNSDIFRIQAIATDPILYNVN